MMKTKKKLYFNISNKIILSQVKYIYIVLFTIQIASKLLHNINQDNLTVFVYSWEKKDNQVW